MTAVDELRRKIEGKAYPLDNETCSLLLDVLEAVEDVVHWNGATAYSRDRRAEAVKKLYPAYDALENRA